MRSQYTRRNNTIAISKELSYEVRVEWNPNHEWYLTDRESAAMYEFEMCLEHANGARVEVLRNGAVIRSNKEQ
jgi:hypothetical protein